MDEHHDQKLRAARARPIAMSRARLGIEAAAETAAWQHGPAVPARGVERPSSRPMGTYRGRGPRGYVRSPARIYEDLCDRLTDNPFVDAADIEVGITGTEVTLNGTVNDPIALRQAQAIAEGSPASPMCTTGCSCAPPASMRPRRARRSTRRSGRARGSTWPLSRTAGEGGAHARGVGG
jgi:hypothetical protein